MSAQARSILPMKIHEEDGISFKEEYTTIRSMFIEMLTGRRIYDFEGFVERAFSSNVAKTIGSVLGPLQRQTRDFGGERGMRMLLQLCANTKDLHSSHHTRLTVLRICLDNVDYDYVVRNFSLSCLLHPRPRCSLCVLRAPASPPNTGRRPASRPGLHGVAEWPGAIRRLPLLAL